MVLVLFTPHQIRLEYDYENGRAEVCSGRGDRIAFNVEFQGDREQGVVIRQSKGCVKVMTFNNYYGKSAHVNADNWERGEGRHEALSSKKGIWLPCHR